MRAHAYRRLALPAILSLAMVSLTQAADDLVPRLDARFAPENGTAGEEVPNFKRHMVPLLGRLGCNGRACHGSFQGRGDFRLSLFGYDFDADHKELLAGDEPRVNVKDIDASLIIAKPTDEDLHEGGQRYTKGGWEYRVIRRWIEAGAKNDQQQAGNLAKLEVIPGDIDFQQDKQHIQLRAIAHWEDGTREDVTPLCRFKSNDTTVASVTEEGRVESTGTGDTHIVVFYDNGITPVPVIRPVSSETAQNYPQVPTPTKIDELVLAKLRKLGIVPAELCSDEEFLRRASLDITGTLPTPDEVVQFTADRASDKRVKKIDELLSRPGYAAWWTTKLCDITGNNARNSGNNQFRNEEAQQWYDWIYHRVAENRPYDELVAGIVTATGREAGQDFTEYCREMCEYISSDGSFAENESMPHFWSRRNVRQPEEKALSFAYAFLGVRLQCAQCHKHPFDQWSKQDFEQFTGFFSGVQYGTPREDNETYREMLDSLGLKGKKGGDLRKMIPALLKNGKVVPFREVFVSLESRGGGRRKGQGAAKAEKKATLLGGRQLVFKEGDDPRQVLMDWMRKEDNPYFAKAIVNRVWASYFHVGIVEPADDMNLANPPSNAALLDWLSQEFVAQGYDLKWLHRTIAGSRTYQLSWRTNETNRLDQRNFSHAVPRRLPAEVAHDALRHATASDEVLVQQLSDIQDRAIGASASLQQRGRGSYMLTTFGKPARETNCDCERSLEPSLLQVLYLNNDNEVLSLIERRDGWLQHIARANKLPFAASAPAAAGRGDNARAAAAQKKLQRFEAQVKRVATQLKAAKKSGDKKRITQVTRQHEAMQRQLEKFRQRVAQLAPATTAGAGQGTTSGRNGDAQAKEPPQAKPSQEVLAQYDDMIRQAYLRSVSRQPSPRELDRAREHVLQSPSPMTGLRDVLWAVLNTKEFITNH